MKAAYTRESTFHSPDAHWTQGMNRSTELSSYHILNPVECMWLKKVALTF